MTAWGNENLHERTMRSIELGPHGKGRRRCGCGCGGWKTHCGLANGVGLRSGCEWSIRQWVRDPKAKVTRTRHLLEGKTP